MGKLFYGNAIEPIHMPDLLLAHLQVLTATKLRRSESFTVTWKHPAGEPEGRSTIWLQPSIPLRFVLTSADKLPIDPALLRDLADQAASSAGVTVDFQKFETAAGPAEVRELVGAGRAA